MHDLAIITISTNEAHWLEPCLRTLFEHAGDLDLDVVVADNMSTDGTRELVESQFPRARVVECENHGFAHANNRAYLTTDARWVLFLNPDTETVEGTYADLVARADAQPEVGMVGVRQLTPSGAVHPTMRRFPNALRTLCEALLSERWPVRPAWAGQRILGREVYDRPIEADWTSGSFMLTRREALESAGVMDERFFIFSEETDLCLRIRRDGWKVVHDPGMAIIHHTGKRGASPRAEAQEAYSRVLYGHKNFSPVHAVAWRAALLLHYALRWLAHGARRSEEGRAWQRAYATVFPRLLGRAGSPYQEPPPTSLRLRAQATRAGAGAARTPPAG